MRDTAASGPVAAHRPVPVLLNARRVVVFVHHGTILDCSAAGLGRIVRYQTNVTKVLMQNNPRESGCAFLRRQYSFCGCLDRQNNRVDCFREPMPPQPPHPNLLRGRPRAAWSLLTNAGRVSLPITKLASSATYFNLAPAPSTRRALAGRIREALVAATLAEMSSPVILGGAWWHAG